MEEDKKIRLEYIKNLLTDKHFKESTLLMNKDLSILRIVLATSKEALDQERLKFIEIVYNVLEEDLDVLFIKNKVKKEIIKSLTKKIVLWREN